MPDQDKNEPWFVQELRNRQKIGLGSARPASEKTPEWLRNAVSGHHGESVQHEQSTIKPTHDHNNTIRGTVADSAEDEETSTLRVHWDEWRNAFLYAVHCLICDLWSMRPDISVPCGRVLIYSCDIANNKEIRNAKILQSCGYRKLDKLVLHALQQFNGAELLQFPFQSKRTLVTQEGGFEVADQFRFDYTSFGDTEMAAQKRQRLR